jgi:outer membrane protein TolC
MLAEIEAEVRSEVGRAAEELREQAHVVELYDRSILPAAEANLEAARSGYEAATSDFSALVTAAKDLVGTRLTRAHGLAESRKALARLERATGGLLPLSEDHR